MDKTWVFVDRTGLGCWWITGWAIKKKKKSLLRPLSAPPRLRELLAVVQVCVEFWGALSLGNQGCLGRAESRLRFCSFEVESQGLGPGSRGAGDRVWTHRETPKAHAPQEVTESRRPVAPLWLGFRVFNSDWIAFSLVCFREIGKGRVLAVGIFSPWKGLKFGYWRDRMWSLMTFCGSTFK